MDMEASGRVHGLNVRIYVRQPINAGNLSMTHVTFTELRANMAKYFDRVEADRDELIVTRQNHEPIVMMPLAELQGLRETLHLLSSPANAEHLRESIAELDAGKGVEHTLIEE